jgi:SAM-dependent methyltransferase
MTHWLVLSVPAPPRGEEHLLVEALLRAGGRSVVREGDRYLARIPVVGGRGDGQGEDRSEDDRAGAAEPVVAEARMAVRAATTLDDPEIRWWWAPAPGEEEAGPVLPLHPTTRACLALLEELVTPGERWLDVGTGTGVLALEAARLGAGEVVALEMDPVAAALAREGAVRAGFGEPEGPIRVRALRAGPGDLLRLGPFHGIVANLEAGVLAELLDAFRGEPLGEPLGPGSPLHPGGHLILSGAHRGEGAELEGLAGKLELTAVSRRVEEGWWAGAFRHG